MRIFSTRMFAGADTPAARELRAMLWLLIISALCYRVWLVFTFNPVDHIWSDTQRHWEQGIDVLRDDPIALMDPILYQVYIGILGKLTLKLPVLVAFYTSLLAVLSPWLWYRFMREALPSRTLALVGFALIAWLPSWSAIYTYFMQETLMLPLLGASLWATWRARRKNTTTAYMLALTLWTLAGLTRAICIPLAAVAMSWVWFTQSQRVLRAIAGLLFLSVVLGPLTYRAYQRAHIFAPHGIGALNGLYTRSTAQEIKINFSREGAVWEYGFGSPSTGIAPFEPLSDWRTSRNGAVHFFIDMDHGPRDWDNAKASQVFDLSRYLHVAKENVIFLFFGESWPDTDRGRSIGEITYQMRWLWAPLTVLVLVGTILTWRRRRDAMLPILMLTWFVLQGLTPLAVNEGRYRKPFEGLLIVQGLMVAGLLYRSRKEVAPEAAVQVPATQENV